MWKGKKDFEEKLFHRIQKSLYDCSSKTSESVQHQLKFKKEVREQLSFFQKNFLKKEEKKTNLTKSAPHGGKFTTSSQERCYSWISHSRISGLASTR